MQRELQLTRPVVFLDFETTGIDVTCDRIIEVAMLKLHPDGRREEYYTLVNPGIPIPPETTKIHGISDEKVELSPSFAEIANDILRFIEGCDLGGFNSTRFDIPLLAEELHRVNRKFSPEEHRYIDVFAIHKLNEPMSLSAIYKRYFGRDLLGAHSAMTDTKATLEILNAQLSIYEQLPNTSNGLADFCLGFGGPDLVGRFHYNEDREPIFAFGKYKGRTVDSVMREDPGYFQWMLKGDFPLLTKQFILSMLDKYKPQR